MGRGPACRKPKAARGGWGGASSTATWVLREVAGVLLPRPQKEKAENGARDQGLGERQEQLVIVPVDGHVAGERIEAQPGHDGPQDQRPRGDDHQEDQATWDTHAAAARAWAASRILGSSGFSGSGAMGASTATVSRAMPLWRSSAESRSVIEI